MTRELTKEVVFVKVENRAAPAASEIPLTLTTDILDMADFESVTFCTLLGSVTDDSEITLTIFGNTASTTTSATSLTSVELVGDTSGNGLMVAEVVNPGFRWVYATVVVAEEVAGVEGVIAMQTKGRTLPVTQDADVLASVFTVDP